MSSSSSYEVKSGGFTVRLERNKGLLDKLNKISEENECQSSEEVLQVLVDRYFGEQPKQPVAVKAPSASNALFVAEIDELDADSVAEMRKQMYRRYKMKDPGILAHWAQVFSDLEKQVLFMVRPPKNTRELIISQGQPLIDEGEVKDLGQFIAKKLQETMKAKKEKGGWFE